MQVGSLVAPRYYIELCEDISLEDMTTHVMEGSMCVVIDLELDDDPRQSMCRVLAPNGIPGWVGRTHLRSL